MAHDHRGVNFDERWTRMRPTINGLFTLDHVDRQEWGALFSDVNELCLAQFKLKLYFSIEKYLAQHVHQLYETVISSNEQLLVIYYERWKRYCKGVSNLLKACLTLELYYDVREEMILEHFGGIEREVRPIRKMVLVIWQRHMIEPLKSNLLYHLLERIRLDLHGVFPHVSVLPGVMESFLLAGEYKKDNLEFYRKIFEPRFLEVAGEYYKQEASRLMQENDCSQYMEKVILKLGGDFGSLKYLHPSSYSKMAQECEERMVYDYIGFLLLESKKMVKEENKKDLRSIYLLLQHFPFETETLIQELQQHITKTGLEAIAALEDDSNPQTFVESFIALYDKFRSFIDSVFWGDHHFIAALDKACISIINRDWIPQFECQSSELLAKYCDSFLKKSEKKCYMDEVENKLNHIITLFKFIDDKDIFEKCYAKFLAGRLVHNETMSMYAEESMLKKLKETAGYEYTNKLQCMFSYVSNSYDLNSSFTEFKEMLKIELGISFSISVIPHNAWPFVESISTFSIPQVLNETVKTFESFHKKKFHDRKLKWLHHMADAELKLCYLEKPYVVSMSTYQMAILLLFERTDVLTYKEIKENTNLSDEQLSNQIKSLLKSKLILATDSICQQLSNQMKSLLKSKLILTMDSDESFEADFFFSLNKNYYNKRTNFKLAPATQKNTEKEEVIKSRASVSLERKIFLRAAIARLMKSKKELWHRNLTKEVINQSKNRFVPNVRQVKRCIEELIDKECIERSPDYLHKYCYVEGNAPI